MHSATVVSVVSSVVLAAGLAAQGPETKQPRPPQVQPDVKVALPQPAAKPASFDAAAPVAPAQPAPVKVEGPIGTAIDRIFANPDFVLQHRHGDGRVWGMGRDYKASFGDGGARFYPWFGTAMTTTPEVAFGTPVVTVGGASLDNTGNELREGERRVEVLRGGFVERYDLKPQGIEQQFVFAELPQRGDLVVRVPVQSSLQAVANGDGILFRSESGKVGYSQAVAVDAASRRLPLRTVFAGEAIVITVPAAFVANAKLPLVIDPLVGVTETTINTNTRANSNSDVSYDATNDEYLVVWQRDWSTTDQDCFAQRMTAAWATVGGVITVDFTGDCWEKPKCASNNIGNNHLVVAQVSTDLSSPYWIAGVLVDAGTGTAGAQFDIARASVTGHAFGDKLNPDVGGDPVLAGPTYYTVVWERDLSATDHDIHMKQVTITGALRSASPTLIDNGTGFESNPSISKSDGIAPFSTQRFAIAYQRRFAYSGGTEEDIRGSLVTWDGQIVQVGSADNFSVDFSSTDDQNPTVSSPTDTVNGSRYILFAYDSQPRGGGQGDIIGSLFDETGGSRSGRTDLNAVEAGCTGSNTFQGWSQLRPSADSDGCRFVVGYEEQFSGTGSDWDTQVSLFGVNNNSIVVNQCRLAPGFSGTAERFVELTSAHSGGGGDTRYAAVWQDDMGTADDVIEGQLYDGYRPGSVVTRPTGCGGLGITAVENRLGRTMTFTTTGATGLAGFVFGIRVDPAVPIPGCGACSIGVSGGNHLFTTSLAIMVPCNLASLVGQTYAAQGFDFSTGPCFGQIKLSDTVDVTIE